MTRTIKTTMNCLTMAPTMNKAPLITPPDPKLDGIAHINVHYDFATQPLGRQLASYYVQRFEHPFFGPFRCVEACMLYLKTGARDDHFRGLTGSQAKAYYRDQIANQQLTTYDIPNEEHVFLLTMYARLSQHPVTAKLFTDSTLPFENYFLWSRDKKVPVQERLPIRPDTAAALIQTLTTLRKLMRANQEPEPLSREAYTAMRK